MARPANKPAHRGFPLQVRKTFIEPVAPTGLAAPSNPVHLVENISARKLACVLRLASCVLCLVSCVLCLLDVTPLRPHASQRSFKMPRKPC